MNVSPVGEIEDVTWLVDEVLDTVSV